ncbi:MAG: acyl-CoA dehydrogenase family protein [Alphaproteobacteria bacterium]|jgi:alkylation response protein AidB-like acyl-CoA dehydrogenase|nr:acyl-CoA dehydrogenase family protein [Alphaproteobacteria bacterium]
MSAMLDDILFCMTPVGRAEQLDGFDRDEAAALLEHYFQFIEAEIAPLNGPGDAMGARLENGRVIVPDGFCPAYQQFAEQGWMALGLPEAWGGQPMPTPLLAGFAEILSGANHAFQMIVGLVPGAAHILDVWGGDEQKQAWLEKLASGEWLATMNLTEPQAGSDLARIRTQASPSAEPIEASPALDWEISGQKIFISGGDQNMSSGILHMVLARTGTAEDGVRGLSLFAVPSLLPDGSRNSVSATRLEEKMGIHASPTCEMLFERAKASLIGQPGEGLKLMFVLMNHARLDVGLQGVAHAARSHLLAAAYAAERVQGRLPEGGDACLADHPDIQRMLGEMQILMLGARALCQTAASLMEAGGEDTQTLLPMLTSLAKVCGSEAGIEAADLGVQILGGYGYLREYQLEQHYRDARITSIYEGANGIHARTLALRLNRMDNAPADFASFLASLSENPPSQLIQHWQQMSEKLAKAEETKIAELADGFTKATSQIIMLCLWQRMAEQAAAHPEPDRIRQLADRVASTLPYQLQASLAILDAQLA